MAHGTESTREGSSYQVRASESTEKVLRRSLKQNKQTKKNSAFDILLHMHTLWLMNSAYIGVLETMNTMSEVKRNVPPRSPHFLKDYELYIFLDS